MADERRNDSGVQLQPYYGEPPPGEFPYTRGIRPDGYRGRLWTMRQYAGFGTAASITALEASGAPPPSRAALRAASRADD